MARVGDCEIQKGYWYREENRSQVNRPPGGRIAAEIKIIGQAARRLEDIPQAPLAGCFSGLAAALTLFAPASLKRSSLYRRTQAGLRYLSYKSWKIDFLRWFSPSLGVLLLGAAGVVFFLAMTLSPQPYY